MRCLAVVLLCLVWMGMCIGAAFARPSPQPPVTRFNGDRYAGQVQVSTVLRTVRPHRRHKTQRAPRMRRIALAEGMTREVFRATGGRPAAWCGWWLGQYLQMPFRHLWLARNWAKEGVNAGGPKVGAVVVWAHHVGIITGRRGNRWVVKSGNDGRRVRERPRSVAGAIAFRIVRG